jgi:hypothetical protein
LNELGDLKRKKMSGKWSSIWKILVPAGGEKELISSTKTG